MKKFVSITGAFLAGVLAYACVFSPVCHVAKAADKPSSEFYKVFETTYFKDAEEMQRELNKLPEKGWRVKTGLAYKLVLERASDKAE